MMHLGPGLNINAHLINVAENYMRGLIGTNLAGTRVLRAASHIYEQRDQYPYEGNTITWQQAQAIARWTSRAMTAAQQMYNAHGAGEAFEGGMPQHMGAGPGVFLTVSYTVNFATGHPPATLYYVVRTSGVPSAEQVLQALEDNAEAYAFDYNIPGARALTGITYHRAYQG